MRLPLLLAALALLSAPGAVALVSVGVEAGAELGSDADDEGGAEATVSLDAEAAADADSGALEGGVDADADAAVEAGVGDAVEVDAAVGASVDGEPSVAAAVEADAPGEGAVEGAVEAVPLPSQTPPPSEPEPVFEPAPHSDVIDDPSTDPEASPWSAWTPGTFDAAAEARAALVAVPLAAGTAAAVAASLAPAAVGRALSRAGRFLAFLPLLGLFSRVDDAEMDDHPTRAAIVAFVRENPGASIQDVRGAVDVAWGTAVYHLRRLEDAEHLVSERFGRSRRFWARNAPESRHRDAQAAVAADTPRALLEAVAARPGSRQKELCAVVGCSAPVASKYLKRLAREGLVSVAVSGRDRLYFLADGAARVPTVAPLCPSPSLPLRPA